MEIVKTIALKKSKLILIVSKKQPNKKIRPSVTSTEADLNTHRSNPVNMS